MGGILYALLTLRARHQGRGPVDRLTAAAQGRIRPPHKVVDDPRLPAPLCRIAMRALSRRPADRYESMQAFKADLDAFLRGAGHLETRSLPAGAEIVVEGEPGAEAFVIKSGRCRVHQASQGVIRELGPGDVFGELAVLTQSPRTTTVTALSPVELLVVTRGVMREGLGLNSWMGVFVTAMARRFTELEAQLTRD